MGTIHISEKIANHEARIQFVHPGEALDGPVFAGEQPAMLDLIRELITVTMPPLKGSRHRRYLGAYRRWVAIMYVVAPEYFNGVTAAHLARDLGMSWIGFEKQVAAAKQIVSRGAVPCPHPMGPPGNGGGKRFRETRALRSVRLILK